MMITRFLNFLNCFFVKRPTEDLRVISEDEKALRNAIGKGWIKLKGEDDPTLEAVLNAAMQSGKVVAQWDSCQGLEIKNMMRMKPRTKNE